MQWRPGRDKRKRRRRRCLFIPHVCSLRGERGSGGGSPSYLLFWVLFSLSTNWPRMSTPSGRAHNLLNAVPDGGVSTVGLFLADLLPTFV